MSIKNHIGAFFNTLLISAIMGVVVFYLKKDFPQWTLLLNFSISVGLGVLLYLILSFFFNQKIIKFVKENLGKN